MEFVTWNELRKHRAHVTMGFDQLMQLIEVPEGTIVTGVSYNPVKESFEIFLNSFDFEKIEPGTMSPQLPATVDVAADECGQPHIHIKYNFKPQKGETNAHS